MDQMEPVVWIGNRDIVILVPKRETCDAKSIICRDFYEVLAKLERFSPNDYDRMYQTGTRVPQNAAPTFAKCYLLVVRIYFNVGI